jgi:hypothetical protein
MGETLQIDPEFVSVESKVLPNIRMMSRVKAYSDM